MKSVRYYKEKWVREGQENRDKIFDFINENGPVSIHDIHKEFHLSMHTIYLHISDLLAEKMIYKNKIERTYVSIDHDLGYITTFAKYIREAFGFMISSNLINPSEPIVEDYSLSSPFPVTYPKMCQNFCERVKGISTSRSLLSAISRYHAGKFRINELYLFEFANRVGAYITYILIESMRPIDYNSMENSEELQSLRRDMLSRYLLEIAINHRHMFQIFHSLLFQTQQIKNAYNKSESPSRFFELDKEDYKNLIGTFKKTYPKIYDGLESYWKEMNYNWLLHSMDLKESISKIKIDCKHKWRKVNIFKLDGDYYHCRKCNNVLTQFQLDRINPNKR